MADLLLQYITDLHLIDMQICKWSVKSYYWDIYEDFKLKNTFVFHGLYKKHVGVKQVNKIDLNYNYSLCEFDSVIWQTAVTAHFSSEQFTAVCQ